jgi:predicted membrane protein
MLNFSKDEIDALRIISQVISSFSIAGDLFIILTYWFFKENRSFLLELVLHYSIMNIFYSVTSYFPYVADKEDIWCALQSFMMSTFQDSLYITSAVIGYTAFISVIKKDHIEKYQTYYRILFIFLSIFVSSASSSMYNILIM